MSRTNEYGHEYKGEDLVTPEAFANNNDDNNKLKNNPGDSELGSNLQLEPQSQSKPQFELTTKLRSIYSAQDTLPKLIEDESVPIQKMDEYYVDLHIIIDDKDKADRIEVESSKIFDAVSDQPAADKLLIIGRAGVGKTTLLQHISYEWGKGTLFNDKFDYVFKVKLKLLLDKEVREELDEPIKNERLAQLIKLSIERESDSEITTDEIINLDKKKTLLLLDGYDEVMYLASQRGSIVYEVMQNIFNGYNVVLTSRPNSLTADFERKFNRKLENTGLTQSGSVEYIRKYFSKQKEIAESAIEIEESLFESLNKINSLNRTKAIESIKRYFNGQETLGNNLNNLQIERSLLGLLNSDQNTGKLTTKDIIRQYFGLQKEIAENAEKVETTLIKLLDSNPSLSESIKTPLNAALVCLICSDSEFVEKFSGEFSAGKLYEETIIWLGKRYLTKFKEGIVDDIIASTVFKLGQVIVQEQLANMMFKESQTVIDGGLIEEYASKHSTGIREVNKFGLLRPESRAGQKYNERNLIESKHSFIHLSFQEYLNAYELKEQLLHNDERIIKAAAEIIAKHRNEPRWQMTLKFLSGILSSEKNEVRGKKARDAKEKAINNAIQIFWEAIACNVDGVLELAIDKKISLFMHLLAQSIVGGEIDERIPNRQQMMELIDVNVTRNIVTWSNEIIASGYLSPMIKDYILGVIGKEIKRINNIKEMASYRDDKDFTDKLIEITSGDGKSDIEDKIKNAEHTMSFENQILATIPLNTGRRNILTTSRQDNHTFLELSSALKILVQMLAKINHKDMIFLLSQMQELISSSHIDFMIKETALLIITDILVKYKINEIEYAIQDKIISQIIELIKNENISKVANNSLVAINNTINNPIVLSNTLNKLMTLFGSDNNDTRIHALTVIGKLVEAIKYPEVAKEAMTLSTAFLGDSNPVIRKQAVWLVGKAVQINKNSIIVKETCTLLIPILANDDDANVRLQVFRSICPLVEPNKDPTTAKEIITVLLSLGLYLKHFNVRTLAEESKDFIRNIDHSLELIAGLITKILDSSEDLEFIKEVFTTLVDLLKDHDMGTKVVTLIGNVLEFSKKPLVAKLLIVELITILKDNDVDIRSRGLWLIGILVGSNKDPKIAKELYILLVSCLKDVDNNIKWRAASSIMKLAELSQNLEVEQKAFELLISFLRDLNENKEGCYIKRVGVAASIITKIYSDKDNEQVIESLFLDFDKPDIKDETSVKAWLISHLEANGNDKIDHIQSFMAELDKKLCEIPFNNFYPLAQYKGRIKSQELRLVYDLVESENYKSLRISLLQEPKVMKEIFLALIPLLKSDDKDTKYQVINVIGSLITLKQDPEFIKEVIIVLVPFLKDDDQYFSIYMEDLADKVIRLDKDSGITKELITSALLSLLNDSNQYVRIIVLELIAKLGENSKDCVVIHESFALLLSFLQSDDWNVRWKSANLISKLAELSKNPEIVREAIKELLPFFKNNDPNVRWETAKLTSKLLELCKDLEVIKDYITVLLPFLKSGDYDIKKKTAQSLGDLVELITTKVVIEDIMAALKPLLTDDNDSVKCEGIKSIGKAAAASRDQEIITSTAVIFMTFFTHDNFFVRLQAEKSLKEIVASSKNSEVAKKVIIELGWLFSRDWNVGHDVVSIIPTIMEASKDLEIIQEAFAALVSLSAHYDRNVRWQAVESIAKIVELSKDSEVTKKVIKVLVPFMDDSDVYVRAAAAKSIGMIIPNTNSEMSKEAITVLLRLLKDNQENCSEKVAESMIQLAESSKDPEYIKEVIISLLAFLTEDDRSLRERAARSINKILELSNDLNVTKKVIVLLLQQLAKENPDFIKVQVIQLLGKIVELIQDKEVLKETVITLEPFLKSHNASARVESVRSIVKVLWISKDVDDKKIVNEVMNTLTSLLIDKHYSYLPAEVMELIEKVASISKNLEIFKAAMESLVPLLSDNDRNIRDKAKELVNKIINSSPNNENVALIIPLLIPLLKDNDRNISNVGLVLMNNTLASLPIQNSAVYLKHDVLGFRKIVINLLTKSLSDISVAAQKDLELVETILKEIIAYESAGGERKDLIKVAKKCILSQQEYIDDETILWATAKFDELFRASEASKPFLQAIYHKALSDGVISVSDSKYILECIKHGFTTSIIQDPTTGNYKLIFEDKTYLLEGVENTKYIEEIAEEILKQENNLLAQSYRNYQPLFANSGVGIASASLDIRDVPSLAPGVEITRNEWQVTLAQESDNLETHPSNTLLLFEKRDVFGNHVIHKINIDRQNALSIEPYQKHPDDVDLKFRTKIFGEMSYVIDRYPLYYVSRTVISSVEKEALFNQVNAIKHHNQDQAQISALFKTLQIGLELTWNEYLHSDKVFCCYREDLHQLTGEAREHAENMRKRIDDSGRIEQIEKSLNENIHILSRVIAREKISDKEYQLLDEIYNDPYSRNCYENLRMQLNSVYLAASVITTGMVQNQQKSIKGNIGTMLSSISPHIPIVGAGINFLGSLLVAYDQNQALHKLQAYTSLVHDAGEMAILSGKISLKLISKYKLTPSIKEEIIKETGIVFKYAGQIANISANLPKMIVQACDSLHLEVRKFIDYKNANDDERIRQEEIEEGENDAAILVKMIVKSIYEDPELIESLQKASDIVNLDEMIEQKAESIVESIAKHYKLVVKNVRDITDEKENNTQPASQIAMVAGDTTVMQVQALGSSPETIVSSANILSKTSSKVQGNSAPVQKASSCCGIL